MTVNWGNSTSIKATQTLRMPNNATQLDVLTRRVSELEEEVKVWKQKDESYYVIVKKLKAELKKSKHMSSDIQRVCTQMAKGHANSSNTKSKGLA